MIDIQAIYCLSRPERQDRRDVLAPQLEKEFARGSLPRLPIKWWCQPLREECFIPPSMVNLPGYWCATTAHRLILEDIWNSKAQYAIVMEDDARILETFTKGFPAFLSDIEGNFPDWMALWVGHALKTPLIKLSRHVCRNKGSTGTHFYVVNRHGVSYLLNHMFLNHSRIVDWAFHDMMVERDFIYSPATKMVSTTSFLSDNHLMVQEEH